MRWKLAVVALALLARPATAQENAADSALMDALLAGPAETLGATESIEIPMETDPSGRPIVPVFIDGRGPYRFGIDWGANIVIVSEQVAEEAGLTIEGFLPFPGREGRDVARVAELGIGGVALRGLRAAVGGFQDTTVDGILGFNAFRDMPITLDFPGSRVRLGGAGLSAPDGERTLALVPWTEDFVGNRPAITIRLGDLETPAWLDTRSPLPLVLPETMRGRFTAVGEAHRARARGPQTGDMELEIVNVAESLVLGAEVVESPLVAFRSLPDANPELRLFDQVILGGPLLRQFAITLDLAAGAVRFDRDGTGPIQLPMPRPRPPGR